jgi:hypothetical protein
MNRKVIVPSRPSGTIISRVFVFPVVGIGISKLFKYTGEVLVFQEVVLDKPPPVRATVSSEIVTQPYVVLPG